MLVYQRVYVYIYTYIYIANHNGCNGIRSKWLAKQNPLNHIKFHPRDANFIKRYQEWKDEKTWGKGNLTGSMFNIKPMFNWFTIGLSSIGDLQPISQLVYYCLTGSIFNIKAMGHQSSVNLLQIYSTHQRSIENGPKIWFRPSLVNMAMQTTHSWPFEQWWYSPLARLLDKRSHLPETHMENIKPWWFLDLLLKF